LALVVELRSLTPTKDAELETMYGYCVGMTREDLRSREEARSALRRGCDLAPRSGEALYRMALFERKEGQLAAALRTLREAVDVDPHHVDAARELRLFGMRVASGMDPVRAMSPPHGIPAVKDPRKE
jgi:tetratricopeptide (TPR) repeat protein